MGQQTELSRGEKRGTRRWVIVFVTTAIFIFILFAFVIRPTVKKIDIGLTNSIVTNMAHGQLLVAVAQAPLPANQNARMFASVDRLWNDFKSGKLSSQNAQKIMLTLAQSPVVQVTWYYEAQANYIDSSSLTPDQKNHAALNLHRFVQGACEGKVPLRAIDEVKGLISTKDSHGDEDFKRNLTAAELQAFIAAAKKWADSAHIPDKPQQIDMADEFDKAVTKAMTTDGASTISANIPATSSSRGPETGS